MKRTLLFLYLAAIGIGLSGCRADPGAPAGPAGPPSRGEVRTYATLHSVGLEWAFDGEGDCRLRYRSKGSGSAWNEAWPPYRVSFEQEDGTTFAGCAGSVFYLEPDTVYELWLTLEGEAGPIDEGRVEVRTLSEPAIDPAAPVLHVAPGSGGGSGTADDPYLGIREAQQHARPGTIFLLHPGVYADDGTGAPIRFTASGEEGRWVVWKAAGEGVVLQNRVRVAGSYVWIEGVQFQSTDRSEDRETYRNHGINSQKYRDPSTGEERRPRRVVLKGNTFSGYSHAIWLGNGGEAWYIVDNVIVGTKDDLYQCIGDDGEVVREPPCPGITFAGEGIDLNRSHGHTVAHNRISRVADGISYPGRNVDIFRNVIFETTDDAIETDHGGANLRVWENLMVNIRNNGFSAQPVKGGPWYFLRNMIAAPRESNLKVRDRIVRILFAHNLFIGWDNVIWSPSRPGLGAVDSLNNIYVSANGRYIWEQYVDPPIQGVMDYDAFDKGGHEWYFKWGSRYETIEAFHEAKGQEAHGIVIDRNSCFENWEVRRPPEPTPVAPITLRPDCPAVDAGVVLPNLTGPYTGAAPDLGPYEVGLPLPHYGPR